MTIIGVFKMIILKYENDYNGAITMIIIKSFEMNNGVIKMIILELSRYFLFINLQCYSLCLG